MVVENYSERIWRKYVDENKIVDKICPICGYIGLYETSPGSKEKNVCPKCQSNPRTRLYYMYLLSQDVLKKKMTVIGVSPDKATRSKLLSARDNVDYLVMGIPELEKTGYKNKTVDLIMANYVIDRVEDKSKIFKEIKRILKDDGKAMLSVFFRNEDDSVRIDHYTEKQYVELLEENGFDVEVLSPIQLCEGRLEAFIYGINLNDRVIIATKRL